MCALMTMNYKAKKKVTPVADQITEDSETSNQCSSVMEATVRPSGTKYLEIISSNGYSFSDVVNGNVSVPTTVTMTIDAFKSFQTSQNTISSSITLRVRTTVGGTIEDSIRLYRDHTANIC